MKLFPQLALVSAIAISGNAMAMQALDDSALSATTGQDGIAITISGGVTINEVIVHDTDGLGNTNGITNTGAGAIVIGSGTTSLDLSASGDITVDIDADSNNGAPVLNVAVGFANGLQLETGDIAVATSNGVGNAVSDSVVILDSIGVNLGAGSNLNIQLGNAPQGAMIALDGTVTGGLEITNLSLNDASLGGGGSIDVGTVTVTDAGFANTDLTLTGTQISVTTGGLEITGLNDIDVALERVDLGGSGTFLGDVELLGLNTSALTITIAGK